MRIHLYDEEVTGEVTLVTKTADTGIVFKGVRVWLASPDVLHDAPDDDDRSAVTFWFDPAKPEEVGKYYDLFVNVVDLLPIQLLLDI